MSYYFLIDVKDMLMSSILISMDHKVIYFYLKPFIFYIEILIYPQNYVLCQYTNGNALGGFAEVYKETVNIRLHNLALLESAAVPCFMCCLNVLYIYLIYYLKDIFRR